MGRRAKLLKPHSWGAADICLFSISPSVSLLPSTVFYPHFTVLILSACLCIPSLYVYSLQHQSFQLFYSFSFSFCFALSFPLLPVVILFFFLTSRVPQALSGYVERICIIFSPESVCNHHALLPTLCDVYVTIL